MESEVESEAGFSEPGFYAISARSARAWYLAHVSTADRTEKGLGVEATLVWQGTRPPWPVQESRILIPWDFVRAGPFTSLAAARAWCREHPRPGEG